MSKEDAVNKDSMSKGTGICNMCYKNKQIPMLTPPLTI